jgi:hypothetical protein
MTTEQAKEILLLYRPDTSDANDPQTAEALELAKGDGDLRLWLDAQVAAHEKIRRQFAAIPVSEGLREQIISERPVETGRSFSFGRVAVTCVLIVLVYFSGSFVFRQSAHWWQEREAMRFTNYSEGMVFRAINAYGMDLATADLKQIRAYFAAHQRPADYALPPNLAKATATGCVAGTWHGRPVAMICFRSPGKAADQGSDLWFFVINSRSLRDAPQNNTPEFSMAGGVPVASWTADGQTYLLAYQGDVGQLKAMLE